MEKDAFSERMARLEQRIAAAQATRDEPPSRGGSKYTQGSLAWRMVIELVAGMGLGLGIGFGLDALFGTRPVMLVIFALLGFAAGIRTMMRTASEVRDRRAEGALLPRARPGDAVVRGSTAAPAAEQETGRGNARGRGDGNGG